MNVMSYLGNCVASKGDIMECVVRKAEGGDVQKTLHLMDDGICEREGLPVLHVGAAFSSNHIVNLLLHFL